MIEEFHVSDIGDLIEAIRKCSENWTPDPHSPEELWYRGQSKGYALLPGLYRPDIVPLRYEEENLQERFCAYGTPYVGANGGGSAWDWYFRAQHYGIPTRLLDWTESLLTATYFALIAHVDQRDRRIFLTMSYAKKKPPIFDEESPVVWVLDAGTLNQSCCGPAEDCVFTIGGPRTDAYSVERVAKKDADENLFPIAIMPQKSNSRIVAQAGMFTIHGKERVSIDELAARDGSCIRLARLILDRANPFHFWRDLERLGIDRTYVFPELESVAHVVKWFGQYPDLNTSEAQTKPL